MTEPFINISLSNEDTYVELELKDVISQIPAHQYIIDVYIDLFVRALKAISFSEITIKGAIRDWAGRN